MWLAQVRALEVLALLTCVAVGLVCVLRAVRGGPRSRWWGFGAYTMGSVLCVAGAYLRWSAPDTTQGDLVPPWPVVLMAAGLVLVSLGSLLWVRRASPSRSRERAETDDEGVRQVGPDGEVAGTMRWDDLREVWIRTTDLGPFSDDVFIAPVGAGDECVIPSESQGVEGLLERLTELPGFDEEAYTEAIRSTDNARFCVWRRTGELPTGPR
jgi:hypothetical protein